MFNLKNDNYGKSKIYCEFNRRHTRFETALKHYRVTGEMVVLYPGCIR